MSEVPEMKRRTDGLCGSVAKRLKQRRPWHLMSMAPEVQLLILQKCDATTLTRIDRVCKALSIPRPPLSLLQRVVQQKLRSEYRETTLNLDSWPAHLVKIENAHRAGSTCDASTCALGDGLMLGDDLLKSDRTRAATMRVLAKMVSAKGNEINSCARVIMELCAIDSDAVVGAGALPFLVGLLGIEEGPACCSASRAIWTINKGGKHQLAVVRAGAVGPLVDMLGAGSLEVRIAACRTLFRVVHGHGKSAKQGTVAVVAAGATKLIVALLHSTDARAVKAAASLLCGIASNSNCGILEEAVGPLAKLLGDGPIETRAYAAQALVDIAASVPSVRQTLAQAFCRLLAAGTSMLDWFQVTRGLAIVAWRSHTITPHFADLVVEPLTQALLRGFPVRATENCVVMALSNIGASHILAVAEPLVSAMLDMPLDAQTRIARVIAAIARTSHRKGRASRRDFHSTGLLDLGDALIARLLPPLVQMMERGGAQAKKHSADCIGCLANERRYISTVVASGAIQPLVSILHGHNANSVKQYAAMAIGNIAFAADHLHTIMRERVLDPLVQLLALDPDLDGGEFAAMAISSITFDAEYAQMAIEMGALTPLVRLVRVVHTQKPLTGTTLLRQWRVAFTQAWSVIALMGITASQKHQAATDALEYFVTHLPDCSHDTKSELSRALLEMCEKRHTLLQNVMLGRILDELTSNGCNETSDRAKEARRKLKT
jgi:hypothetical protein